MHQLLDFRERSRLRRALYAKPTILLLGILVVFLGRAAWNMYQKSGEALEKRDKVTENLRVLKASVAELNEDISRLSTERGQEEQIRDRFMVAKEGEKVIIVSRSNETATHTVTVPYAPASFFETLKGAIGLKPEE